MAGKADMSKESYWRGVLKRQAASGLSIQRFCTESNVSQPSFYAWRRKFRERERERERGTAHSQESTHGNEGSHNGRGFVSLSLLDSAVGLEVIHPLGYRIRIGSDVDITVLRRVLEALDRRNDR